MSRHTPGKWVAASEPLSEHTKTVFALTDAEIAPAIAGGDTPEQRDANAALIAAAPDMLAALALADAWLTASAAGATPATHGLLFDSTLTTIRAARAAAEGTPALVGGAS